MTQTSESLIREAEKTHYAINADGSMLFKKNIGTAVLIWSDIIEDFFWNYAGAVETDDPENLIREVTEFYEERDRTPGIYVTPASKPEELEQTLLESDFEIAAKDAWMFYRGEREKEEQSRIKMKTVESKEDIESFVEVFGKSYGGEGEDEAYADLPDYYTEAERKGLEEDIESETAVNFIVDFKGDKAGIASVRWKEDFAGIYDIGVIPEHRGEGIGSTIVNEIVRICQEKGIKQIFLQTEKGSSNEEFFRNRGFETEFTGKIIVRENGS